MFIKSVLSGLFRKIFTKKGKPNVEKVVQKTVPTIREAVLSQEGSFTTNAIINITGKSRRSVNEILRELLDKGVLIKYKDAMWEKLETKPIVIDWNIPPYRD